MRKDALIKSIINEYGIAWAINRQIYSFKIKMLNLFPFVEKIFEPRDILIKRINIFDINTRMIKDHLNSLPEKEKSLLVKEANDAIYGRIKAFSSVDLDYGFPIKWNYSPVTKKEVSLSDKWYTIPDFDTERGDIKIIWEASRFTHFYLFTRAYLLTGERKYYDAFRSQLADWIKENRYSYGPNFKCSQECSLRMINVLMNYSVFEAEGIATKQDTTYVCAIVKNSYKKILSNFFYAYKCIKNNHTISELLGMIIGAWCCEDNNTIRSAYKKVNKVVLEQFFSDGGYKQYSFNYERLALQDLECLLSISQKTGYELSKEARQCLKEAVNLMFQCQSVTGDVPNYGSNDGALIFPVTSCGYRDYRPTLNSMNVLLTGCRLYEHGLYDEELHWFNNNDVYAVNIKCNVEKRNQKFDKSGLLTLRDQNIFIMLVANDYVSRPAHLDQLHFDLWINEKNVFCDSGTYSYSDKLGNKLVMTSGHNTVVVDGMEQMNVKFPFFVFNWTKRNCIEVTDNSIVAEITSKNGYTHRRQIEKTNFDDRIELNLVDIVETNQTVHYSVLFHTPYKVIQSQNKVLITDEHETEICEFMMISKDSKMTISDDFRSLHYQKIEPVKCIKCHCVAKDGHGLLKTKIVIRRN